MQWKLLDKGIKYQGFFSLSAHDYEVDRYQGGQHIINREVFHCGKVAAVLAYDPQQDTVVLVEQFRCGAALAGHESWQLELIAGLIEPGEQAIDVASREAVEEAGCELTQLKQIAHYLPSPGATTEEVQLFVACCDSTSVAEYAGLQEEGEDIRVRILPRTSLMNQLEQGQISNAMTLIASQWLALNYEQWEQGGYTA